MQPARPHCGQEGGNQGFPLLVNQPLSFRARCARKSKSRFPSAAQLPQRVSRTGATPEMTRRGRRALRSEGWSPPFLFLGENGRRKLWRYAPCARSAPLFAAANAANFGRRPVYLLLPKRKWGDSQEGRNFVSPLLCACRAQRHRLPGRALRAPTVMRIYFVPRRAVAHLPPSRHRLQGKVVFLW